MLGFKTTKIHIDTNQLINIIGVLIIPIAAYQFTLFQWAICLVGYFMWQNIGISAGYHKLATHRQYSPPVWFKIFTTICGTMAAQGPVIHWASQHTAHHAYSDTTNDPHSPAHKGFWNVVFNLPYLNDEVRAIHSRRVITDSVYRWQNDNYWLIIILMVIGMCLIDPMSIFYFWLVPCGFARLTEMYLTAINHRNGSPVNNHFLGLIAAGEGWHKNHHESANRLVLHSHDWFGKILQRLSK
jgi:fatty-acid desaturase